MGQVQRILNSTYLDDCYMEESLPTLVNDGTTCRISLFTVKSVSKRRTALLRMLCPLLPAEHLVARATLTLNVTTSVLPGLILWRWCTRDWIDGDTDFNEYDRAGNLTWESGGAAGQADFDSNYDELSAMQATGLQDYNITELVRTAYLRNPLYPVANIIGTASGVPTQDQIFDSSTGTTPPVLTVDYYKPRRYDEPPFFLTGGLSR